RFRRHPHRDQPRSTVANLIAAASHHAHVSAVDHGNKRGQRCHLFGPALQRTRTGLRKRGGEGTGCVTERTEANRAQPWSFTIAKPSYFYLRPRHVRCRHQLIALKGKDRVAGPICRGPVLPLAYYDRCTG